MFRDVDKPNVDRGQVKTFLCALTLSTLRCRISWGGGGGVFFSGNLKTPRSLFGPHRLLISQNCPKIFLDYIKSTYLVKNPIFQTFNERSPCIYYLTWINFHVDGLNFAISRIFWLFAKINPREIFEKWLFAKINPREINFKNSSVKLEIGIE